MGYALGALKKAKKNIRRVFSETDTADDAEELYRLLSMKPLKPLLLVYSSVISAHIYYAVGEGCTTSGLVHDVCEDLKKSATDGYFSMPEEAEKLLQIFSKGYIQALGICIQEIASGNFFAPTLPSVGIYFVEGTVNSFPRAAYSDFLRGQYSPIYKGQPNGTVKQKSVSANTIPGEGGNWTNSLHYVTGGVKLTGGGEGPPMKPVCDDDLMLVSFKRNIGEDLGITVGLQEKGASVGYVRDVYVKRVMVGSQAERLGLLGEGDIIREVNGVPIDKPETLQEQIAKSPPTVTLKIIPAHKDPKVKSQLYVRALFTYDPEKDKLLPCKEAGLRFQCYDILQVLNQSDPNWWQARHYDSSEHAALIPSDTLEERRKTLVESLPGTNAFSYKFFKGLVNSQKTKKTKIIFKAKDFEAFTSKNVCVYEEVALISGFQRPVICLLGAPGVGRQTLRDMLIEDNPERYELAVPYTSRERLPGEQDGVDFFFEKARKMQSGYQRNHFIEFGEADGAFYGTKVKTLRRIAQSGKTCLLDCSPSAVSRIRTAEFMPFVVFLAAPSCNCMKAMYEYGRSMGLTEAWKRDEDFRRTLECSQEIERNYRHLFDKIVICDNIEVTFTRLKEILDDLLVRPQWVSAKWLY
ncbi:MAGUK p55 subfamily member 2 [Echinococcus granulosus]|uniref:MAGUK p55 subfamily member 2 n=1 Tax=Echinococcus granulosus TaxID=6210 RepID=W6UXN8_ECHGR|nr:MAGUK p55 subfamily member 2 [Echinococcus granulosus]EUB63317.1 MAGUK p55 subfamily member 2 [Echinococcus granulosus]